MEPLIPVKGSCVVGNDPPHSFGIVKEHRHDDGRCELRVHWPREGASWWVPLSAVRGGFQVGMEVADRPRSHVRRSLGEGTVMETRRLGGREQVLVDFPEAGRTLWLPYENLRHIRGVRQRFELSQFNDTSMAERMRLRCLAHALDRWNDNTGALAHLDIDPLPHQIHLVHHILASGSLNWLIADDVGLGKTIEMGMLLSALLAKGRARRILLVTPSGLVRQWREELHCKFGISDFLIYGRDFRIDVARNWRLYDHVIASMDLLKADTHLENLLQGGAWDVVIFDEAHRLSRSVQGARIEASDRFRLAARLRALTDSMLLLTATPHQGKTDKFKSLLELIRPDLKKSIQTLEVNPEILRRMIVRNNKADVADAEGRFIFQGKTTSAVQIVNSPEELEFDQALQGYLKRGYQVSQEMEGRVGLVIGLVMTVYRKLSASSLAAIVGALERRHARLLGNLAELEAQQDAEDDEERFEGETEEGTAVRTPAAEFFVGELKAVEGMVQRARGLVRSDRKVRALLDQVIPAVSRVSPMEKTVIFTEYRATQDHLVEQLREHFGDDSVVCINGSMNLSDREAAIEAFEEDARFLVSTEAGGEGINLHRRCHVVVNFDLPWNPMRLVQRVGRLYRYGQKHRVLVFNMHAPDTFDGHILAVMYERIEQVVRDMTGIGGEFRPGLEEDILGQVVDLLEVDTILSEAGSVREAHTEERIRQALERAKDAAVKQRELLSYVTSFTPEELRQELVVGRSHLQAFIEGMLPLVGITEVEKTHRGNALSLKLPDAVREELGIRRQNLQVTTDRSLAATRKDIRIMDFNAPFLQWLVAKARSYEIDGRLASITGLPSQALVAAMLRWQSDQGSRMREEFCLALVDEKEGVRLNAREAHDWLLRPAQDGEMNRRDRERARRVLAAAEDAFDERLAERSNTDLHPENRQLVAAAWTRPPAG